MEIAELPVPRVAGRVARRAAEVAGLAVAFVAAFLVAPWLGMNAGLAAHDAVPSLDPDNAFVYIYVHHAVQALTAIAIAGPLMLASNWSRDDFGLRRGDLRMALRATAVFGVVFGVITVAFDLLPPLVTRVGPTFSYPLTPSNVAAMLIFEWLVVGVSEEVLFRGFALGVARRVIRGRIRIGRGRLSVGLSVAGLIVAVLFGLEHGIRFSQASFLDVQFVPNWSQIGLAFVLGVFYAELRERSGSLLGPILTHNLSDGLVIVVTYLAAAATSH